MSLFRQGQRVVFVLPALRSGATRGTIIEVINDSELGAERDMYAVELEAGVPRFGGMVFHIRNEHVQSVIEEPQPTPEPQIRFVDTDQFRWDIRIPNPVAPDPLDEVSDEEEAPNDEDWDDELPEEEEEEDQPQIQQETPRQREASWLEQAFNDDMRQRLEESIRASSTLWGNGSSNPTPTNETNQEQAPIAIRYSRSTPSNRPTATALPNTRTINDITYNEIEAVTADDIVNHTMNNVRPIGMLTVEGVRKPVYDAAALHLSGQLAPPDYTPTIENRYYALFTIERTPLKPAYDTRHGIIVFKSDRGTVFVNDYIDIRIQNIEFYRDIARIRWARRDNLHRYLERNGIAIPSLYPKKKLRLKYKEMPKIKEEKYYGSKEFIC